MSMDSTVSDRSILEWDESDVQSYLESLGYPQYEAQIREHKISGDVLCMLDSEGLKAVGISTIGQRLSILKSVYQLKLAHHVPIDASHYVPLSEALERVEAMTLEKLHTMVNEQATRIRTLEEDNRQLNSNIQSLIDQFNALRTSLTGNGSVKSDDNSPLRRQPSFKWANYSKPQRSPTKLDLIDSPHPSPQQLEHDLSYPHPHGPSNSQSSTHSQPHPNSESSHSKQKSSLTDSPNLSYQQPPVSAMANTSISSVTASAVPSSSVTNATSVSSSQKPHKQESTDNLKSFKVSLEDPTWKVLPAALKKYRINNDNWQNYAMFICYGSPGNRIERCLSYDEKPLLLFQRLKDAKKNPVFMLKHIKDIRSPIAVAQQKHAARKASSIMTTDTTVTSGHAKTLSGSASSTPPLLNAGIANANGATGKHTPSRSTGRPPKLQVNDLAGAPTPLATGLTPQPGWPEPGVLSPSVEGKGTNGIGVVSDEGLGSAGSQNAHPSTSLGSTATGGNTANGNPETGAGNAGVNSSSSGPSSSGREVPPSTGVSYAVAIYPYMAEQDDEFDVVVGDTFVILSRARGWWVVQRDPTGSGTVEPEISKQGWVPAGCLLETNVPVASAIAEATASKVNGPSSTSGSRPDSPINTLVNRTPILPLSIISTSFPGIALMDYKGKGEEELDLVKDDLLRVFKRYNHWSYAVKEDGGDRGWVPSWFIGKVTNTPATPNSSAPPNINSSATGEDSTGQLQVSPMSSAFPPVQTQTRTATVI